VGLQGDLVTVLAVAQWFEVIVGLYWRMIRSTFFTQ